VGAGLLVQGLGAYVFLVVSARALGPQRYSALTVLWTLVFFAAPGFLFPIEQEVSRAVSARRALGLGGGPVIKRAAILGGGLAIALMIVSIAVQKPILEHLFDHQRLLLVALVVSLPAYAAIHLSRGALSGSERFVAYGSVLGLEGAVRVIAALALVLAGVHSAGAFGLLVALGPAVAVGLVLARQRNILEPGPEAPWSELSEALGWLLLGAVLAQAFVNASVPLVKVLAPDNQKEIAGQFQAGLIISRVPLFLFQAVQAALLPKLAGLAAKGRITDFRTGLRRLVIVVIAVGVLATLGAWAVGPFALRTLFGAKFNQLGHADLGYLALGGAAFMLSTALSQALIALKGYARVAAGWFVAIIVFGAVVAVLDGLLFRVEMALVSGALVSVVAMSLQLRWQMRSGVPETADSLIEAVTPEHEIIEP
jgi:O-antigen/teichoic acid export membrane protein